MKKQYKELLEKYHKQEEWIEKYPNKVTDSILNKFKATISDLGELGYKIEQQHGPMALEEKLGKVGKFQKEVIKQLKI